MVIKLQRRLNELGYSNTEAGTFTEETKKAVEEFQKSFDPDYFAVDGIAGPQTFAALYIEKFEEQQTEKGTYNADNVELLRSCYVKLVSILN